MDTCFTEGVLGKPLGMLILIAIGLSAVVGTIVAVQARRWPAADPAAAATDAVGAEMRGTRFSRFVRRRLDPATATGLALTVSLGDRGGRRRGGRPLVLPPAHAPPARGDGPVRGSMGCRACDHRLHRVPQSRDPAGFDDRRGVRRRDRRSSASRSGPVAWRPRSSC